MNEIVVIPASQMQEMLQQAAYQGAQQALAAHRAEDKMLNQKAAAALLGVDANYFSSARLWEHIPYATLPGGERRYRVSDVLAYKGPAEVATEKTETPTNKPGPGRKSMLLNIQTNEQ